MKEFDFDELDKAVNSLMGDIKKPAETPAAGAPVAVSAQPAVTSNPEPEISAPEPPTTPISTPTELTTDEPPAPSSPPASSPLPTRPATPILPPRRSGGRFMDVVHPSSDMSSSTPSPSVSTRQGKPLEPLTMANEAAPAKPMIDVMAPVTPVSSPETEVSPPAEDVASSNDEAAEEPASEPTTPNDPWSSPFLPDTQVEKRPLGGGLPVAPETGLSEAIAAELSKGTESDDVVTTPASEPVFAEPEPVASVEPPKDEPAVETVTPPASEVETTTPATLNTSETTSAPIPDELTNDLVAIESGQKSAPLEADTQTPRSSEAGSTSATPPTPLALASIPPQYDEQPSSGDASHTPIYDNEAAAHQPLAHPAKKKKGWVLIVFIVGILVVGGALGALAYFLGLV